MAAPMKSLEEWLADRLLAANPDVDLEIFVPYVTGILDTDTPIEDKRESLEEVLEQVVESGQAELCGEIIRQWEERNTDSNKDDTSETQKLDMKLSEMLGQTNISVVKPRVLTEEERARKAAIIAQYDHLSDGEEGEEVEEGAKGAPAGAASNEDWMTRNVNSLSVLEAEREKREKSKSDHEKKKEKDRTDRETQRQKQLERKDAEKKRTQKGEKRR